MRKENYTYKLNYFEKFIYSFISLIVSFVSVFFIFGLIYLQFKLQINSYAIGVISFFTVISTLIIYSNIELTIILQKENDNFRKKYPYREV